MMSTIDASRKEFGFTRTVCGCRSCQQNCEHIPGYIIPCDLERFIAEFGNDWPESHLLASPGAVVAYKGRVFRVPTLVPARQDNGKCIFYKDGLCSIHRLSGFGCSFFDTHMSQEEADTRSTSGIMSILRDGPRGKYISLWQHLWNIGRRALSPEECRTRMRKTATG